MAEIALNSTATIVSLRTSDSKSARDWRNTLVSIVSRESSVSMYLPYLLGVTQLVERLNRVGSEKLKLVSRFKEAVFALYIDNRYPHRKGGRVLNEA